MDPELSAATTAASSHSSSSKAAQKNDKTKSDPKSKHPPTIYLIRHGEKPSSDSTPGLSPLGIKRAQALPAIFGPQSSYNISLIIAQKPKKDGSRTRPLATITPLCKSLGLKPDISIDRDDYESVADAAKGWKGKGNVLICWEHDALEEIARTLVGDEKGDGVKIKYPGERFDLIWRVWWDDSDGKKGKEGWRFEVVGSEGVEGLDEEWA